MDSTEMGKRMKQRRTDMEISVMDLVDATGLSKATLHRYENGSIKHIKTPVLQVIAFRLGVSLEWLMGETDNMDRTVYTNQDIHEILSYALDLIRDNYFTNRGEPVDKNTAKIIELSLAYLLTILDTKRGNHHE